MQILQTRYGALIALCGFLAADPIGAASDRKVVAGAACLSTDEFNYTTDGGVGRVSLYATGDACTNCGEAVVCPLVRDNTTNTSGLGSDAAASVAVRVLLQIAVDRPVDCWVMANTATGNTRQEVLKSGIHTDPPPDPGGYGYYAITWTNGELNSSGSKDVYNVYCTLPATSSSDDEDSLLGVYYIEP
ncbi:MAG: hypothetical protein RJA70_4490 [Pseudomonadota bacterium]|jgi:hypothetical protein